MARDGVGRLCGRLKLGDEVVVRLSLHCRDKLRGSCDQSAKLR